jgi:hypothetical protein
MIFSILARHLKRLLTERTTGIFRRDKTQLHTSGRYYRFNVISGLQDIGLEESTKMNVIQASTSDYIESEDVFQQMKSSTNSVAGRQCQ